MNDTTKKPAAIDKFYMFDEYQRQAMRTANKNLPTDEMLLNSVMGMCGEAGEAIDLLKKHRAQGAALDVDRLVKEAAIAFGISQNSPKLRAYRLPKSRSATLRS